MGENVTNRILAYQIVTMIQKRETCLYCGQKMESKTAKKKFCTPLHRVYYNRELNRGAIAEVSPQEPLPPQFAKISIPGKGITEMAKRAADSPHNKEIEDKIAELERQLQNPPKSAAFSVRAWEKLKRNEIQELKKQLK